METLLIICGIFFGIVGLIGGIWVIRHDYKRLGYITTITIENAGLIIGLTGLFAGLVIWGGTNF